LRCLPVVTECVLDRTRPAPHPPFISAKKREPFCRFHDVP
jgi:hypothetical protein